MAQPSSGAFSLSFQGAMRRAKDVLQKPQPPDVIGAQHPQHQAFARISWYATPLNTTVPYRILHPGELMYLPGTWALFQLFEAIQLRVAWQRDETPGIEELQVVEMFGAVAQVGRKTPFFPEGNVSPMARFELFKLPALRPNIDWAVYLERTDDGNFANLTRSRTDPIRIAVPGNVWLNPETDVWEATL